MIEVERRNNKYPRGITRKGKGRKVYLYCSLSEENVFLAKEIRLTEVGIFLKACQILRHNFVPLLACIVMPSPVVVQLLQILGRSSVITTFSAVHGFLGPYWGIRGVGELTRGLVMTS